VQDINGIGVLHHQDKRMACAQGLGVAHREIPKALVVAVRASQTRA
jgi:hypothetical protein